MQQNTIEKIAQRHAVGLEPGEIVRSGMIITIRPRHIMTHDNSGAIIPKFKAIFEGVKDSSGAAKAPRVHDPRQPVFAMDHDVQNTSPENLAKYAAIANFASRHGIDHYPPGRGIAHQILIEEGYVTPGALVVGSDSHSNLYGASAALGTPVVRTDAASIWATGVTWWEVPPVASCKLTGRLRPGVSGKDVIITLCGVFHEDETLNCAVEFHGQGVATLSPDERMTIANMTTEWGALAGVFPFDEAWRDFMLERADHYTNRSDDAPRYSRSDVDRWWSDRHWFEPDPDTHYARELTLDLSTVTPHVSGPDSVKVMTPVAQMQTERVKIDKAYLMSCVNARVSDFIEAASAIRKENGEASHVAPGVHFYIAAASSEVEAEARRNGSWKTLVEAGATELPPGCGACIGLGAGTLEPGEVGVSSTNRNFKGRMGSRDAKCYLASPAVVAASAVAGYIAAPADCDATEIAATCVVNEPQTPPDRTVQIVDGFPERLTGRILYLPQDNLNTDGMYGKDVTYRDDITFEQQGQYAMLNYDPEFQRIAQRGDIIVGGRNFGCGSSREQAATTLASKGVQLVICATASQTFKRNAFNNGFIVLTCPALADALAHELADEAASTLTIVGPELTINFKSSVITMDGRNFPLEPLSPTAQRLIAAGGSESLVRLELERSSSS